MQAATERQPNVNVLETFTALTVPSLLITFLCFVLGAINANAGEATILLRPVSSSEADMLSATAFGLTLAAWVEQNERG